MDYILALETSCDETGIALVTRTRGGRLRLVKNLVASQIPLHAKAGGVIPPLAAREHVRALEPLWRKLWAAPSVKPQDVIAIAVTTGPGLVPALVIGIAAAQTLAHVWRLPLLPIHHLEGHIAAAWLHTADWQPIPVRLPVLSLVVSGGHTELILSPRPPIFRTLGSARDDAAGEAFDKIARLLHLPYPGGPALARLARRGNPRAITFPRPMLRSSSLDFSFAGLKTAVARYLARHSRVKRANLAASFQQAVIETLVGKTRQALDKFPANSLIVAGGVAANTLLRQRLSALPLPVIIPPPELCTDNAAMIAAAAWWHLRRFPKRRMNFPPSPAALQPFSRLPLEDFLARAYPRC
jgi:N6-L-threonylcarbamoyladenine synthase